MKKNQRIIFISHSSEDREIAELLSDFLILTGIPRELIRCSSLPGNDVRSEFPSEIRQWIRDSSVCIALLSEAYYRSVYCMNEAGILWFQEQEKPLIPVGLPEVSTEQMSGFLGSSHLMRRLDSETDLSQIYDIIADALDSGSRVKTSVISNEISKTIMRYEQCLRERFIADEVRNIRTLTRREKQVWSLLTQKHYTKTEAARLLGIAESTVERYYIKSLIEKGYLKAVREKQYISITE